jgi:hypothetical protein
MLHREHGAMFARIGTGFWTLGRRHENGGRRRVALPVTATPDFHAPEVLKFHERRNFHYVPQQQVFPEIEKMFRLAPKKLERFFRPRCVDKAWLSTGRYKTLCSSRRTLNVWWRLTN